MHGLSEGFVRNLAALHALPPEQKGAMLADLTFDYYTGAVAAKAGGMAAKLAKRAVGLGAAAKEAGVAGTLAREAEQAAAQAAHAARETEAATAGCVGPQKPKMPGKGTFAAEAPAAAEATVAAEVPKAAPKAGGIGEAPAAITVSERLQKQKQNGLASVQKNHVVKQ